MCVHFVAPHRSQRRALDFPQFIGSCELVGGNHYKPGIAELLLVLGVTVSNRPWIWNLPASPSAGITGVCHHVWILIASLDLHKYGTKFGYLEKCWARVESGNLLSNSTLCRWFLSEGWITRSSSRKKADTSLNGSVLWPSIPLP